MNIKREYIQQHVRTLVCVECQGPALYKRVDTGMTPRCHECKRKATNIKALAKGRKRTLAKSDGDVLRTLQRVRHEFTNRWIRVTAPPIQMKCKCGATAIGTINSGPIQFHSESYIRRETPGG